MATASDTGPDDDTLEALLCSDTSLCHDWLQAPILWRAVFFCGDCEICRQRDEKQQHINLPNLEALLKKGFAAELAAMRHNFDSLLAILLRHVKGVRKKKGKGKGEGCYPRELYQKELLQQLSVLKQVAVHSIGHSVRGFWDQHGNLDCSAIIIGRTPSLDTRLCDPICLAFYAEVWHAQGLDPKKLYQQYSWHNPSSCWHYMADAFLQGNCDVETQFALRTHCRHAPEVTIPNWVMSTRDWHLWWQQFSAYRVTSMVEWNNTVIAARMILRLFPIICRKGDEVLRSFLLYPVIASRRR
eukprot:gnl/MRDRNA2_/MRDRNA2_147801_c0_seq1.p1 gnl/MRDRNA2_/MRDRNA2_147801_c0~~gnl/MRDRNA2_/MRDRNA2_147801_c0_seq1.p1  ORF type:complete len:299 (-),score=29.26 gnl/MRDRNA2_/MRDRNA2_147801_c0_seq1:106-1002(-)